ncbi:hypothetical protein BDA99DRAFT_435354 [Phascolomyces articulosus]|uniref:DDE Tnp4 domain-containing protein n=1 Tax=Phascolomyces articulosus TaxID=60185 RepID=A0AAD5PGJ3_9FUNG|nr:hypothetical protein BDA99DRAFT_435354 [Phascolomyces articulosus]
MLANVLGFGERVFFREGTRHEFSLDSMEAMVIMLRRLAYPARLDDITILFGRSKDIFNQQLTTIIFMMYNDKKLLLDSGHQHIVGFIDRTLNAIAHPIRGQEAVYNEPSIFGPFAGTMHDQSLYDTSGLDCVMAQHLDLRDNGGPCYNLYGDPAYRETDNHARSVIGTAEELNEPMSSLRICVEWEFRHITTQFAFLKYKPSQKVLMSPVGSYYIVATFLKNLQLCLNGGNQTSNYFGISHQQSMSISGNCYTQVDLESLGNKMNNKNNKLMYETFQHGRVYTKFQRYIIDFFLKKR